MIIYITLIKKKDLIKNKTKIMMISNFKKNIKKIKK